MNGFKRLILILYVLLSAFAIVYLACGYFSATSFIADFLLGLIGAANMPYVLLVCLLVLVIGLVVILLRAVFGRSANKTVKLKNDHGTCEIESNAIVSVVRVIVNSHAGIDHIKTDVRARNGNDATIRLAVKASVGNVSNLSDVAAEMQGEVKEAVEKFTGVTVSEVSFKLRRGSEPTYDEVTETPEKDMHSFDTAAEYYGTGDKPAEEKLEPEQAGTAEPETPEEAAVDADQKTVALADEEPAEKTEGARL